jgi:hypothetical protein
MGEPFEEARLPDGYQSRHIFDSLLIKSILKTQRLHFEEMLPRYANSDNWSERASCVPVVSWDTKTRARAGSLQDLVTSETNQCGVARYQIITTLGTDALAGKSHRLVLV